MKLLLPMDKIGRAEPIVVSGATGRGDMLYISYDSPGSIRVGIDHWARGGQVSDPITIDATKPQELVISTGPLHERDSAVGNRLYVEVNGKVVWSQTAEFYPAEPDQVFLFRNPIGGSTTDERFTGKMLRVDSVAEPGLP